MESFLTGRVPDLKFDLFPSQFDGFNLEVDSDGGYEGRVESVVREPEQDASFSHAGISNQQKFEK